FSGQNAPLITVLSQVRILPGPPAFVSEIAERFKETAGTIQFRPERFKFRGDSAEGAGEVAERLGHASSGRASARVHGASRSCDMQFEWRAQAKSLLFPAPERIG